MQPHTKHKYVKSIKKASSHSQNFFAAMTKAVARRVARSLGQDPLRRHCLHAGLYQRLQHFDINVAQPLDVEASLAASVFAKIAEQRFMFA